MHDTIKNPTYYALIAALIILYFVYSPGLGGTLYYDDFRPISGLGNIVDLNSKIAYVLGETSGPLGRPISMLTFLANQNDWPDNVHNILLFNIILHCINAVIVFFLCNLIIKLHDRKIRKTEIFALSASMLWMFSPLLISTSLIAVQRMAGLSALFVFLGLTLYLSCFKFQKINEKVRLVLQMLVIGTFTTLAMLSKENGILLPVFALVIELTILRENSLSKKYKQLRIFSFSMCLSIIIAYLAHSTGNTEQSYMSRSFTMTERLFTQPVILFEYVRLAFIPDMFSYRPFHDNYQHFSSPYELKPLLAIIALFSLFLIAVIKIKKIPLFSFAVFWFISAHLLESTNLSLELYFEHRNYVALLGPCIAIAVFLQKIPERYKNLSITIFSLYILLLVFSSYNVASLWGNPQVSAKIWFEHAAGSARATEHYAIQLLEKGDLPSAYQALKTQTEICLDCIGSQAQAMQLACRLGEQKKTSYHYERLKELSSTAKNLGSAPSALNAVINDIKSANCVHIDISQIEEVNLKLLPNPGGTGRLSILVNLHQISKMKNDKINNINYLKAAWEEENNRSIGQMLVGSLLELEMYDEALFFIEDEMCSKLPKLTQLRGAEIKKCDVARSWLREAMTE